MWAPKNAYWARFVVIGRMQILKRPTSSSPNSYSSVIFLDFMQIIEAERIAEGGENREPYPAGASSTSGRKGSHMNIASNKKNLADWVNYYLEQTDWFVKQQCDFKYETDVGLLLKHFSSKAKIDIDRWRKVGDGLFLKVWEKSENIQSSVGYKEDLVIALTANAALSLHFAKTSLVELSLSYAMQTAQIFGMLVGASNLFVHELNVVRTIASLKAKRSRGMRSSDIEKEKEKDMIKAKYFELYKKEGKPPSASRIAGIMRPICKAINCSEQVIGRWIRGKPEKGIIGWCSEYATTQLEK